MAGVTQTIDDQAVVSKFNRLLSFGRNPTRALQSMGRYGKSSTQLRFRTQIDPNGQRWRPSKRVEKSGGMTLRLSSRLRNSITWQLTNDGVEWGSNLAYAPAMHFGVDERQNVKAHWRAGRRQRTTRVGARISFAVRPHTRHMKIAARGFVGVSLADRRALLDILGTEVDR